MILPGGRFTGTNNTLRALILNAYGISASPDLLQGGPGWIDSARYDVEAKAGADLIPEGAPNRLLWEKTRLMLQQLLADRFKLSIRRGTKEMPAFDLVVAKNGPMLEKSDRNCSASVTVCHAFSGNPTRLSGSGVDMYDLALTLSSYSGRPSEIHSQAGSSRRRSAGQSGGGGTRRSQAGPRVASKPVRGSEAATRAEG